MQTNGAGKQPTATVDHLHAVLNNYTDVQLAYLNKYLFPVLSQAINSFMIDAMRTKHFQEFAKIH